MTRLSDVAFNSIQRPKKVITLQQLFGRLAISALFTFTVIGMLLLWTERMRIIERTRLDTIAQSAANTSLYYSELGNKLILGEDSNINELLRRIQEAEHLSSAKITSLPSLTKAFLDTCHVDYTRSYYFQVPTCYEMQGEALTIYHEIRSAGYSVGYLVKKVTLPPIGLFNNKIILLNMALVLICFSALNGFILFCLRRYVIIPITGLVESLRKHYRISLNVPEPHIFELQTLAVSLQSALDSIEAYQDKTKTLELEAKLGTLAAQVAHDIRAPLAALNMASSQLNGAPSNVMAMFSTAVKRIGDITSDLSNTSRKLMTLGISGGNEDCSVHSLTNLVESMIAEKRFQYRAKGHVSIDYVCELAPADAFSEVNEISFKRVLSNLIDNAIEAITGAGTIRLKLENRIEGLLLTITDNGRGISPDVLPNLMQKGGSYNKPGGSGLGLFNAKETIKRWNGSIKIESTVGKGSVVTIILCRHEPPVWLATQVIIARNLTIVTIDDDELVHRLWKDRFGPFKRKHRLRFLSFHSVADFLNWYQKHQPVLSTHLFLFDFEFPKETATGLDTITALKIGSRSILVTGQPESSAVKRAFERYGIKILPKNLIPSIPIHSAIRSAF